MSRFTLEEEGAKHDAREAAEYYLRKVDLGLAPSLSNCPKGYVLHAGRLPRHRKPLGTRRATVYQY